MGGRRLLPRKFSPTSKRTAFPVLIHCGPDGFERPSLFEMYIAEHPRVTVQLAHSRPVSDTLRMLRKYPNTVCDTAFTPAADVAAIRASGFVDRMLHGTDFPITHYRKMRPKSDPTEAELVAFLAREGGAAAFFRAKEQGAVQSAR